MSTIKLLFATHNIFFRNLLYHLKKGHNPYWIPTIRTRWHVCHNMGLVCVMVASLPCNLTQIMAVRSGCKPGGGGGGGGGGGWGGSW